MARISLATRLSLCLGSLTLGILLAANALNFFPDPNANTIEHRREFCQTVAIFESAVARHHDTVVMLSGMQSMFNRNSDVLAATIHDAAGKIILEYGQTAQLDESNAEELSLVHVPIIENGQQQGTVDIRFKPLAATGFWSFLQSPTFRLLGFIALACTIAYAIFLRISLGAFERALAAQQTQATAAAKHSALSTESQVDSLAAQACEIAAFAESAAGKTPAATPSKKNFSAP